MPTTIQIQDETRSELEKLKISPRQTYDEVVRELITLAEEDTLEFSKETIAAIKAAREDIRKGRVLTTKELITELKL